MPRNSLKKLLDMFPWFFDKNEASNFFKSQSVTNAQFQQLYNDLFKVYQSFHLDKKLLIWKEQVVDYEYIINFVANFPHLKSVKIYKNDEVIYSKEYNYEENISTFNYSYEDSTVNDVEDVSLADIIPQHKFKIEVETYDEYFLKKGFPENTTIQGNEYDHDISLDHIGKLNNIPRKEYLIVDPEFYPVTEPPYNDQETEDDYHYMNRILQYMQKLHTTPAPVLEIWKLYGIDAKMENREKLLLKVFDINRHPHHYDESADGDQLFVDDWTPEPWEHKDIFYDWDDRLGKYFFVKTSTKIPVKNQDVILYFKFTNSLGQELTEQCTVDIILDNNILYSNLTSNQKTLLSSEIPEDKDNTFTIIGRDSSGEIISSQNVIISVRGCNNGDFYVNPSTGSDNNDGKTRSTAFKTIQKAVNSVNGDKNLIILLTGDYEIRTPIYIEKSCTIMGCGSVLIENLEEDLFFTLEPNKKLILQDLTLQYHGDVCNVTNQSFTNNNGNGEIAEILILFTNAPILVMTKINFSFANRTYDVGDPVNFVGQLTTKYGDGLANKTITVVDDKQNSTNYTTNQQGGFLGQVTAERIGNLTLQANYAGDSTYKLSTATATAQINIRLRTLLSDYDYVVLDMEFNEDSGEWEYTKIPVNEISKLSDLNGAILNLQYNGFNVQFERFYSYSTATSLSKTDINNLKGLLVGIAYDDYNVQYMTAHIFGESHLTLSTNNPTYNVGDTITFTGILTDQYNDPIANKSIIVNNNSYSTNENGVYTGSINATASGTLILTANYPGDNEYDSSTATKSVEIFISLASVLSDYDYVVMDMQYDTTTKDWNYITKPVNEISKLSDLNGAVMNLNKVNDNVQFVRFNSSSENANITKSELESLVGLLVAIVYDDYDIKYTKLQI